MQPAARLLVAMRRHFAASAEAGYCREYDHTERAESFVPEPHAIFRTKMSLGGGSNGRGSSLSDPARN